MKYVLTCLLLSLACISSLHAVKPSQYPTASIPAGIPVPVLHGWEDGTSGTSSGGEANR